MTTAYSSVATTTPPWSRPVACAVLALFVGSFLLALAPADAAYTEPRLALTRATPYRATSGRITLKLEGTFSFADALQLGLPLSMTVTQGSLRARFDIAGNAFTSTGGGPEQAAPGPALVSVGPREITVILPQAFSSGVAMAQVILTYEDRPIASNALAVIL